MDLPTCLDCPSPARSVRHAFNFWLLGLLFVFITLHLEGAEGGAAWKPVSTSNEVEIYERPHKDSSLREFKAVGIIEADPAVVKQVLDDVKEYPRFMPYMAEARLISQEATSRVSYQRISPPLVGDRDYTVRVNYETHHTDAGTAFVNRWQAANDLGPAEKKGVARVKITEGSWLLEPIARTHQTRATYCIYSDSGGGMPAAMINMASRTSIPKLFEAVRKQVKAEKYLH